MKTKQLSYCFAATVILLCSCSCKGILAQEKYSEEKIKEMLRNFYTNYIIEYSTFSVNQVKRDSIVKRFCTPNVFNQFTEDVDYDIFLKSQMIDPLQLTTLTTRKDSVSNDIYYVSYTYGNRTTTIKLKVVKDREAYKIDLVYKDM
jgi:hypothetical protein